MDKLQAWRRNVHSSLLRARKGQGHLLLVLTLKLTVLQEQLQVRQQVSNRPAARDKGMTLYNDGKCERDEPLF